MLRHLLSPDPAEGSPPANPPDPAKPSEGNPPTPTPPLAAKTVVEGKRSEREAQLEADLKKVQTRMSELEDENRTLKTPKPQPEPAPEKKSWLKGATFFDEEG